MRIKHGMCGTKFYTQWRSLWWGGTDKEIDSKWKDFDIFYSEMYEKYKELEDYYGNITISLTRLDKTKSYNKGNCYWKIYKEINKIKLDNVIIFTNEKGEYVLEDIFKFCKKKNISLKKAKEKYSIKNIQKVG